MAYANRSEPELPGGRGIASSNYLQGCDLVILTSRCSILDDCGIINDLDDWIDSFGKFKRDRNFTCGETRILSFNRFSKVGRCIMMMVRVIIVIMII